MLLAGTMMMWWRSYISLEGIRNVGHVQTEIDQHPNTTWRVLSKIIGWSITSLIQHNVYMNEIRGKNIF